MLSSCTHIPKANGLIKIRGADVFGDESEERVYPDRNWDSSGSLWFYSTKLIFTALSAVGLNEEFGADCCEGLFGGFYSPAVRKYFNTLTAHSCYLGCGRLP